MENKIYAKLEELVIEKDLYVQFSIEARHEQVASESHSYKIPLEDNFFVHCAGGYRSMIASSILKSRGIDSMTDIIGGFSAIKSSGIPIEV